jgi:hypothetical protein
MLLVVQDMSKAKLFYVKQVADKWAHRTLHICHRYGTPT